VSTDAVSRRTLLGIARAAIESAVRRAPAPAFTPAPILDEQRGVFVTLKHAGRLRGCIGRVDPDEPLSSLLPQMAVLSATADPRFPAVSPRELPGLHIEISLLSVPVPVPAPEGIEVGRHGLIVSSGGRRGVLLPQVAVEFGWSALEFLAQTCVKASLHPDAWRQSGTRVLAFETEIVAE
jgi:AmmeMemoRadiSam system protein A